MVVDRAVTAHDVHEYFDDFSPLDLSPHLLLVSYIHDEVDQCDQALVAGAPIADLGWVWKPDTQIQHMNMDVFSVTDDFGSVMPQRNKLLQMVLGSECFSFFYSSTALFYMCVFVQIYSPEPDLLTSEEQSKGLSRELSRCLEMDDL